MTDLETQLAMVRVMENGVPEHYEGYYQARQGILNEQDLDELLYQIDQLYGRDNLKYGDGIEQVRAEALRQVELEWRKPEREWRHPPHHGVGY